MDTTSPQGKAKRKKRPKRPASPPADVESLNGSDSDLAEVLERLKHEKADVPPEADPVIAKSGKRYAGLKPIGAFAGEGDAG